MRKVFFSTLFKLFFIYSYAFTDEPMFIDMIQRDWCTEAPQNYSYCSTDTNESYHKTTFHFEKISNIDTHGTTNHFSHLLLKLVPENYPKNKTLEFRIYRSDNSECWHSDVYYIFINDDGDVISLNDGFFEYESDFLVILCNPLLGESFYCSLSMTGNTSCDYSFDFTPYPIEMNDNWGHQISLKLINKNDCTFYYKGTGFKHFEDIKIKKDPMFGGEIISIKAISGEISGTLTINKNNDKHGMAYIEFVTDENSDLWFSVPFDLSDKNLWYWNKPKFNCEYDDKFSYDS